MAPRMARRWRAHRQPDAAGAGGAAPAQGVVPHAYALFITLRDLFSLKVDMVFYDLTSTYFEGQGPPGIGANGHSRDGKPRNPQVLVGLVLVDGWPIAHHVFEGNRRDAK